MNRHDERLENEAEPIEYFLTKLGNLAFYRRLTTCKPIFGVATIFGVVIKDSENNKNTSCSIKLR